MKEQYQIIALAELDGWIEEHPNLPLNPIHYKKEFPDRIRIVDNFGSLPYYLTNGDEMRRLIEKACLVGTAVGTAELRADFIAHLANIIGVCEPPKNQYFELVLANPRQLSEALLRAHGLWKD